MNRQSATICLLALAAAGCGAPGKIGGATGNEAAWAEGGQALLRPGKWLLRIEEETGNRRRNVPLPGIQQRPPREAEICLTAEQAAEPPPELLAHIGYADRCRRDVFAMADGNLNAVLMCRSYAAGFGEVPQRIWGRYAQGSYRLTHEGGAGQTRVITRIEGRHVGACDRSWSE